MQTLVELLHFILHQNRTLVFGNLGRYPDLLYDTLRTLPSLRILVLTHVTFPSEPPRLRVQKPTDPIDRCDLLLYVEPDSLQLVEKPPLATRVAVFTSHFTFQKPERPRWTSVCYFHGTDAAATQALLERQDFPLQTRNVSLVEMDHPHVLTLSGRLDTGPAHPDTYVIVDLTRFTQKTLPMYLAFWDAFDYLVEHRASVDRWVVCFPEKGRQAFLRFTQKVLDFLDCCPFEHGNLTDVRDILSILPFYHSGLLDKTFPVPLASFGEMKYAAPQTIEEACKVAAMHDVVVVAKNVLWIRP